ncbi:MAG: hypothetical protein KF774_03055 [Planctomyces sp.]|nr:hypothetical protein [Planctomyces sp.]
MNPALENWIPSAVVSTLLVFAGALLVRGHLRSWRTRRADATLDPGDLLHYQAQFRRRVTASTSLAVIGLLIVIGDLAIPWRERPAVFAVYWSAVLVLTGYIILLAVADALATAAHTRASIARLRAQQRQLERQAAELREKPQTSELPID